MAKSRQVQRAQARSARRSDPEARNRTLIVGSIIAAILLVMGIIAYGYYTTQIQPRGKVVLTVGEEKYTLGHVERRMQRDFEENLTIYQQSPRLIESLPDQVVNALTREGKLVTSSGELNIEATEEEIDAEIATQGAVAAGDNEAFAHAFRDQVEQSGLHAGEYRDMLRAQILERKVRDYFKFVAPKNEPQVRARWIAVVDEDDAEEVITRLEAGEDFSAVAAEVSQDQSNKDTGGVVEWAPRGGLGDQAVEDFLFEAEVGERSEPIEASFGGWYVVELLEKDEDRDLDDSQKDIVVGRLMNDWLDKLEVPVVVNLDQDDRNHAFDSIDI